MNVRSVGKTYSACIKEENGMSEADCEYHLNRARVELDLAYRAESRAAADAHLRMSSLHMGKIKELGASQSCNVNLVVAA